MINRREFNALIALAAAGAALPVPALGQALSVTPLAKGLSLISGAGANVVVAEGPDSVVVVDGGLRENAEALQREIDELTGGKPIKALFNTNWRPEHTGLNPLLPPETAIIAHENTRLWQGAEFYVEWEDRHYEKPLPESARANKGFYEQGSLMLGDERIEYAHLPQAHTDGDIYVYFPASDVLVVSDLLAGSGYPVLDYSTGGWIGGMQAATDALLGLAGENTKVVAAQGGVQGRADLRAQKEMLDKAYEKVAEAFKTGRSLEDFKAAKPAAEFGERWGDPELFLTQLYRGTWYHIPGRAVPGII